MIWKTSVMDTRSVRRSMYSRKLSRKSNFTFQLPPSSRPNIGRNYSRIFTCKILGHYWAGYLNWLMSTTLVSRNHYYFKCAIIRPLFTKYNKYASTNVCHIIKRSTSNAKIDIFYHFYLIYYDVIQKQTWQRFGTHIDLQSQAIHVDNYFSIKV